MKTLKQTSEARYSRANRIIIISFTLLAILSIICSNGLSQWMVTNDSLSSILQHQAPNTHFSPDIQFFKVLIKVFKNIVTLNM